MAFLQSLLGKKADELRARMERTIVVSKKLTEAIIVNNKLREKELKLMTEFENSIVAYTEKLDEILKDFKG